MTRRDPREDPTAWIPSEGPRGAIRVAIAHGGIIDFSQEGADSDTPRLINPQRMLERGLDYVALGDWHGVLGYGDRLWYSGAPEATRFKEKEPGYALLVEIDGPGEPPRVTRLPVARTRWLREHRKLDSTADLDALVEWFAGLPERSWTLVRLSLEGALSYADLDRLDRLLEQQAEELLWLQVEENHVRVAPTDQDLARLDAEGFIGDAVQQLRTAADTATPADDQRPEAEAQAAQDALRLLYRFIHEEEHEEEYAR